MKLINKIYFHRQGIIFSLIAVYINLLLVTALHYHAVDFDNDLTKRIETESVQKSSLILSAVHCPVYNFSTSVFQLSFDDNKDIIGLEKIFFADREVQCFQRLSEINLQSLRAPPFFI